MNELRARAASILQAHFDSEGPDAGLKSLDLESTGTTGSRSFDGAAVARADRRNEHGGVDHARVRKALVSMSTSHRNVLTLAYGIRLRTRDIEDAKKRKALRQNERNWRVRLAEIYGSGGAFVLASPMAKRLFERHVQALKELASSGQGVPVVEALGAETESAEQVFMRARCHVVSPDVANALQAAAVAQTSGFIAWLLDVGRTYSATIKSDADKLLNAALDAFAEQYKLTAPPPKARHRSSEPSKTRILASYSDHGYEIG